MPVFYGAIDLSKNELRNAVIQNLGSAPASPVKGQIYFDSTANVLYWYSGTQWVAAMGAAGAVPSDSVTTQAFADTPVPGSSALYSRGDHRHGMPTHLAADHSAIPISALGPASGPINLNGNLIQNVGTPQAGTDAANKNYVDAAITGMSWKQPVRAATTANITLSGLQTIDGVALAANDRVLVKNQTAGAANGLYTAQTGSWIRTTDADTAAELVNAAVFVSEGTTQADTAWVQTVSPITLGTTALVWTQFAGMAGYSAGNGLLLTGNVFSVQAADNTLTVGAGGVAVNTSVIATQAYVTGQLTGVTRKYAAALTGTVAYATGEVVTHNLNTRDVEVRVLNGASPYQAVEVDWEATTVNTVTVRYNPNLGAGFRCVVIG